MTEDHESDVTDAGGAASPGQLRALPLIERFGGIRPMAATLGVAVSTVQGWKQRDAVPANRLEAIRRAAAEHDIDLDGAVVHETEPVHEPDSPGAAPDTAERKEPAPARQAAKPKRPEASQKPPEPEPTPEPSPAIPPGATKREPTPMHPRAFLSPSMAVAVVALVVAAVALIAVIRAGDPGPGAGAADLAEVEGRLDAMEAGGAEAAAELAALAGEVRAQAARQDALASAQADAGEASDPGPALAALEARLGDLAAQVAAAGEAETPSAERLATIERELAALATALATADPDLSGVVDLADRLGGVEGELERLAGARETAISGVNEHLGALVGRLAALETVPLEGLEARLAELGERLAALEAVPLEAPPEADTGRAAATDALLLALAVGQLRGAIADGRPFADELVLVRRVVGGDPEAAAVLAPLAAPSATGVPTLFELSAGFTDVAHAVVAAVDLADDQDWVDRTLTRLRSVVSVRRTEDAAAAAGGDPGAAVSRAEALLAEGELAATLEVLDGIDAVAPQAVAAWLARARARHEADEAVRALESRVVAALLEVGVE